MLPTHPNTAGRGVPGGTRWSDDTARQQSVDEPVHGGFLDLGARMTGLTMACRLEKMRKEHRLEIEEKEEEQTKHQPK